MLQRTGDWLHPTGDWLHIIVRFGPLCRLPGVNLELINKWTSIGLPVTVVIVIVIRVFKCSPPDIGLHFNSYCMYCIIRSRSVVRMSSAKPSLKLIVAN